MFMFAVAALFVLAVCALLSVNLYVQSQGIQTRIEQELSQRLGRPLKVKRISVTPWGGLNLHLSGISIPSVEHPGNFLEAKTFRFRVRVLPLFSRRLVIKEIAVVDPHVVWPQDADGKWSLPETSAARREAPAIESRPTIKPMQTPAISTSPIAADNVKRNAAVSEPKPIAFVPEIRRIKVSGGAFRFLDGNGKFVAAFEDLDLRSTFGDAGTLSGNASVGRISLRDRFFLQKMRSSFRYGPKELELSQMLAQAGGGDVSGHFAMQPEGEDAPFSLAIRFRNVEADRLIADAGGGKGVVKGKLEGSFEAAGKITDPNALTGKGEIFLHDGQLRQYSVLAALGQLLQIEELTQLHLEQAEAKYHVAAGSVIIDQLILRSPNIRVLAKGTINREGKMHLDSQLAINDKVRTHLFKPIRANFQPSNEPGYFAVDFEVSGTIDHPRSNLVEKVVGRDLKDFGSVINSFLGGAKNDRQKTEKSPAPATGSPVASPASSPEKKATPVPSP